MLKGEIRHQLVLSFQKRKTRWGNLTGIVQFVFDELNSIIKERLIICHVELTYAGVFGYAVDIALVALSLFSLN